MDPSWCSAAQLSPHLSWVSCGPLASSLGPGHQMKYWWIGCLQSTSLMKWDVQEGRAQHGFTPCTWAVEPACPLVGSGVLSCFGNRSLPGFSGCKGKRCSCRQEDWAKHTVGLELLVCQDAQITTLNEPTGKSRAQCARKGNAATWNWKSFPCRTSPPPEKPSCNLRTWLVC